jgi:hypothetical protein
MLRYGWTNSVVLETVRIADGDGDRLLDQLLDRFHFKKLQHISRLDFVRSDVSVKLSEKEVTSISLGSREAFLRTVKRALMGRPKINGDLLRSLLIIRN